MTAPSDSAEEARNNELLLHLSLGVGGLYLTLIELHRSIDNILSSIEIDPALMQTQRQKIQAARELLNLADAKLKEEGNEFFGKHP